MRVLCINNKSIFGHMSLTIGKWYEVGDEKDDKILIKDDVGHECYYMKYYFMTEEEMSEKITYDIKKNMKKQVSYVKVNDGFIYLNFYDVNQMYCVYYPEQDNWYIYGKYDEYVNGEKYLIDIDIKTINNSDMNHLLMIINGGIYNNNFIEMFISVGHKNTIIYCENIIKHFGKRITGRINDEFREHTVTFFDYLYQFKEDEERMRIVGEKIKNLWIK